MVGQLTFPADSSLLIQPRPHICYHHPHYLRGQVGFYQLPNRRDVDGRIAAVVKRYRHKPLDHGDDSPGGLGSLVLPVPGRLAHACLFNHPGEGIQLSVHVPDQSLLRVGLYPGPDCRHPLLEILGPNGLTVSTYLALITIILFASVLADYQQYPVPRPCRLTSLTLSCVIRMEQEHGRKSWPLEQT